MKSYVHCVRRLLWSSTTLDTLLQVHRSITAFARFSWYYYSFFFHIVCILISLFLTLCKYYNFFLVLVLSLFSVWTVALHACCTNIRHHCKCSSHILSTNFQRTPFIWQMKIGQIFVCLLGHKKECRYSNTPRYAPPRYANPTDTPLWIAAKKFQIR